MNVINFDPNFNYCGRTSRKLIKLVFALWEYRFETVVEVKGNSLGLSVIDWAVECFYEQLLEVDEQNLSLTLKDKDGNELLTSDDEQEEDWLKDMLISAEIIAYEPIKKENHND